MPVLTALGPEGLQKYDVDPRTMAMEPSDRPTEGLLVPGFVDIHIHGAFGYDFMGGRRGGPSSAMADRLVEVGYESFLPTTVTGSLQAVERAISNLPNADWRIRGFHMEGPFVSPVHPGAQPPGYIVPYHRNGTGFLTILN